MSIVDLKHRVVAEILEGEVETGAGDEGLYFLFDNDFHDGALAVEVELAHDIVQKEQRFLVQMLLVGIDGGHLHGEDGGALLSLAAVCAQVDAVFIEHEVVAMRADEAGATGNFFVFHLGQKIEKVGLHGGVVFVQHLAQTGLIGDVEAAFVAGEEGMHAPCLRHEKSKQVHAPANHAHAQLHKLEVPRHKQAFIGAVAANVAQKFGALAGHSFVGVTGGVIIDIEGVEFAVDEAPPLGRPAFNDAKVVGREEHRRQARRQAAQSAVFNAVELDGFATHSVVVNFEVVGAADFVEHKKGLEPEILAVPVYQLAVLVAAEVFAVAEIINAFEQIGLALAVWAEKDVQRWMERERLLVVVAPVFEAEFLEDHLTVSAAAADRDSVRRSLA